MYESKNGNKTNKQCILCVMRKKRTQCTSQNEQTRSFVLGNAHKIIQVALFAKRFAVFLAVAADCATAPRKMCYIRWAHYR